MSVTQNAVFRLAVLAMLLVLPAAARAEGGPAQAVLRGFLSACHTDIDFLCPGTVGEALAACMKRRVNELSQGCRDAAAELGQAAKQAAGAIPPGTEIRRDLSYGLDPQEKLDVYAPQDARGAPILLLVHGGGWAAGDKGDPALLMNKLGHWLPRGYILVSMNFRTLPRVDPLRQAQDVGRALAYVQKQASGWGGDPARVVLMGHSSGAHLVALVAADPSIARAEGARSWRGTVVLDNPVTDVPQLMGNRHARQFDAVFGGSLVDWERMSPLHRLTSTPQPFLLVCSTVLNGSCPKARRFAERVAAFRGRAVMLSVKLDHQALNAELGKDGDYTARVDNFLNDLGMN